MPLRYAAAVAVLFLAGSAGAQSYPVRPLRFIVPFPPGGGNDIMARVVGQKLTESFGVQVVIDNRAGAGGNIGAETAAHAVPDGYTLFLGGVGSHGINPAIQAKLPYDPVRDFAPVSLIASAPLLAVVHPSVPAKSIGDLIKLARARPGQLNFASSGVGTIGHLSAELLNAMAGIRIEHVPYKGTGPALTDLLGGQVQLMFNSAVSMLPQVRTGKLRALAVTSAKRLAALPEMPTVAESGVPGYEAASWYGVFVPAGTARPTIEKLSGEVVRITRAPDVRERLLADGAEPAGMSPAEFAAFIQRELARWAKVVREAGIKPQ
jgi:tripartite-type tricarboxylate transporter receptor subunit TctC